MEYSIFDQSETFCKIVLNLLCKEWCSFVQQSRTGCAVLVEGLKRNICVIF